MNTITATKARSDLFALIKKIVKGHRRVRITSKEGTAVLLSEEEYENLIETLHLYSIPGLKENIWQSDSEISSGQTYSIDEAFDDGG